MNDKKNKATVKRKPFTVVCDRTNNTPEDIAEGRITVSVTVDLGWFWPPLEATRR